MLDLFRDPLPGILASFDFAVVKQVRAYLIQVRKFVFPRRREPSLGSRFPGSTKFGAMVFNHAHALVERVGSEPVRVMKQ